MPAFVRPLSQVTQGFAGVFGPTLVALRGDQFLHLALYARPILLLHAPQDAVLLTSNPRFRRCTIEISPPSSHLAPLLRLLRLLGPLAPIGPLRRSALRRTGAIALALATPNPGLQNPSPRRDLAPQPSIARPTKQHPEQTVATGMDRLHQFHGDFCLQHNAQDVSCFLCGPLPLCCDPLKRLLNQLDRRLPLAQVRHKSVHQCRVGNLIQQSEGSAKVPRRSDTPCPEQPPPFRFQPG